MTRFVRAGELVISGGDSRRKSADIRIHTNCEFDPFASRTFGGTAESDSL